MQCGRYPDRQFNRKQLKIGTSIEMEHHMGRCMAKKIAKDHLKESPRYYQELVKMESHLKRRTQ